MSTFHERLKSLRAESGVTQIEFAKQMGISSQTMSYYMNGREPKYDMLVKMAKHFDVSTDYLLGSSDIRKWEDIADLSSRMKELSDFLDMETPADKGQLVEIFETIYKSYDALCSAGIESAGEFLHTLFEVTTSINACCDDAALISEGVEHMAFDNLDQDDFDIYASDVLDLSVTMRERINNLLEDLLKNIYHETIQILGKYYRIDNASDLRPRSLSRLSEKIKEMKKDATLEQGEENGEH